MSGAPCAARLSLMQSTTTEGDPVQGRRNIAASAARWSAQHRKKAIFGWLAFVLVAFVVGSGIIGNNVLTTEEAGVGESGRADKAAFDAFPEKAEESVLVQSKTLKADDPKFRAAVDSVTTRLQALPKVDNV